MLMEQLEASDTKSLKRKEKASLAKSKLEQVTHDLEVAERERQALLAREASSAHYMIKELQRQMLEKDTKQYQQPLIQVQPTIQQQSSTTTRSDKISNQVITGPPAAKKEPQKEDDNTRASKLTKNALAGMKRMKKRKPPKRPATPTKMQSLAKLKKQTRLLCRSVSPC